MKLKYVLEYWEPGSAEEATAYLNQRYAAGLEYVEGMMGGRPVPLPGQLEPETTDAFVRQQKGLLPLRTGIAVLFKVREDTSIHD